MNTNVDVLVVLDREIAAHLLGPSEHAVGCEELPPGHRSTCTCNGPELLATRAAVAELIEADKEYDRARAAWDATAPFAIGELDTRTVEQFQPLQSAMARRCAALARVGGAS